MRARREIAVLPPGRVDGTSLTPSPGQLARWRVTADDDHPCPGLRAKLEVANEGLTGAKQDGVAVRRRRRWPPEDRYKRIRSRRRCASRPRARDAAIEQEHDKADRRARQLTSLNNGQPLLCDEAVRHSKGPARGCTAMKTRAISGRARRTDGTRAFALTTQLYGERNRVVAICGGYRCVRPSAVIVDRPTRLRRLTAPVRATRARGPQSSAPASRNSRRDRRRRSRRGGIRCHS